VDDPAVVVESVKLAEDRNGDVVVVRLYEALGTQATARVAADFPHTAVVETDLLERPSPGPACLADGVLRVRPFQLVTLRFST
jgi:alpha-mannosidase